MLFATLSWDHPYKTVQSGGILLGLLLFALPLLGSLIASLTAVVMRYRGSVGEERLQLKWFASAAALVVASFAASFFTSSSASSSPPAIVSVFQSLSFIFLWIAIGIAVLKYRLYEIDVVISKTLVYGLLAAFFTAVYVIVVVGLGSAIGSTHNAFLTLLAAAVVALAFNPVRTRATRLANRIVYGTRASPYEVLSSLSERFASTYSVEDVLPQMAGLIGEGTGAKQARVWLRVADELRPEAVWGEANGDISPLPVADNELPEIAGATKVVAVRHQDDLLGALSVTKPPSEPLTAVEEKLVEDLASQAGLVLRNVRLTEELRANLTALRASRQRLVAAQDEERRRLERNIHDGAQQQLVALAVKANLAETLVARDPDRARQLMDQLKTEAQDALNDLRDLARGIYPPLLADKGLGAALDAQAKRSAISVVVAIDGIARYSQETEAAVYFCCLEALQNVAKYSGADSAHVRLFSTNGYLSFEVTDRGRGFDAARTDFGAGLRGMADRLDAIGGALKIQSYPGEGTTVAGRVPVEEMA
jgi:signal transduction histidine kinase